jgi:hypothetical protein
MTQARSWHAERMPSPETELGAAEHERLREWMRSAPGLLDDPSDDDESPFGSAKLEQELRARIDRTFASHPELHDHRVDHPWLLGALGDPCAEVWFVAENPSRAQLPRVQGMSPELQWAVSDGDKLFRWMLVRQGFKYGTPHSRGGWRCYITDVVKSAAPAGEWSKLSQAKRAAIASVWSDVLRWELEIGQPKLVVSVGWDADELVNRLVRGGEVQIDAPRARIDHYTFVARYYDNRRKLKPGTCDRHAVYDSQFRQVRHALEAIRRGDTDPLAGLDEIARMRRRMEPKADVPGGGDEGRAAAKDQTPAVAKPQRAARHRGRRGVKSQGPSGSVRWEGEIRPRIRALLEQRTEVERIYDEVGRSPSAQAALWEEQARLEGELDAIPATPENAVMLRERGLRWGRIAARLFGDGRREREAKALYDDARGQGAAAQSYSGRGRRPPVREES